MMEKACAMCATPIPKRTLYCDGCRRDIRAERSRERMRVKRLTEEGRKYDTARNRALARLRDIYHVHFNDLLQEELRRVR